MLWEVLMPVSVLIPGLQGWLAERAARCCVQEIGGFWWPSRMTFVFLQTFFKKFSKHSWDTKAKGQGTAATFDFLEQMILKCSEFFSILNTSSLFGSAKTTPSATGHRGAIINACACKPERLRAGWKNVAGQLSGQSWPVSTQRQISYQALPVGSKSR